MIVYQAARSGRTFDDNSSKPLVEVRACPISQAIPAEARDNNEAACRYDG